MPYDHALRLADEIAKVCPWVECSLKGFVPAPSATPEQIAAGNSVFNSFVQDEALYDQWFANRNPDRKALIDSAKQTLADNATFLALGSATNAQIAAQVRALTRQNNQLIRRLVQL